MFGRIASGVRIPSQYRRVGEKAAHCFFYTLGASGATGNAGTVTVSALPSRSDGVAAIVTLQSATASSARVAVQCQWCLAVWTGADRAARKTLDEGRAAASIDEEDRFLAAFNVIR